MAVTGGHSSKIARGSVEPPRLSPARELVAVRQLQLAQHSRDVRLDRLRRDAEPLRDLLVEVSTRQMAEHFALARGQLVDVGVVALDGGGGRRTGEGVQHEARKT